MLFIGPHSAALAATSRSRGLVTAPQLDPNKIVNRSLGFLREREPEMSEVEYALYERMLPIVEAAPETALNLLETMLADDQPESAAFEFVLGNVYFTLKRMEGAEQHYRRAVQQHPTFLRAWVNLGAVLYAEQRFREAVECFSRAVALGDREASTFGLLASSLRSAGNVFAAESAYKQAMTADPQNPDWISGLLEIYLETEQHAPAAALARELVYNQPDEPRHWTLYASLLVRLERRVEAMAALQTAGEAGLLNPALWHMLADLYAEARLVPEAALAYQKSGDGPQGDRAAGYAQALVEEGRLDEAAAILTALESAPAPRDPAALLHLKGRLALARGDGPTARQQWEAGLRHDPLHGPTLLALAESHRATDELAQAELYLEQATQIPASAFMAHIQLAQLYLQLNDPSRAVRQARAAHTLQPADELQDFITRLNALITHENPPSSAQP